MTHTGMCTVTACRTANKCEKEATFFMASQVMKTVDAFSRLEMPAGVYIDIKMKQK